MPRLLPTVHALGGLAASLVLGGCASQMKTSDTLFGFITPYRLEIVQGNVVTKEQFERIKPGLTRRQVRDMLGTPLVTDIFHADRWDYLFAIDRQGAAPQQRSITLHFDGDQLAKIDAPELPAEYDFVASITRASKPAEPKKLELTDEERQALPKPPPRETPPAEPPTGPVRSYPPLEASPS